MSSGREAGTAESTPGTAEKGEEGMIRKATYATVGILLLAPALWAGGIGHYGGQNSVRIHGGSFAPDGESQYWTDKEIDFFGSAEDFDDFVFSADWIHFVSARVGLRAGVSGYEGESLQSYRDFVTGSGDDIFHLATLEVGSFEVGFIVHLLRGDMLVLPYVGAGVGLYDWTLSEDGDFLDFGFNPPLLFNDLFLESGEAFGTYYLAGVEVPIGSSFSVFGEGKWVTADDEFSGDFAGLGKLDLSGDQFSAGVAFNF